MPADSSILSSVIQFSFVFTSLVTVAGWFVVGFLADRRDLRKEVRENIAELKIRAQSVRDSSKKYWIEAKGGEADAAACTLKAEINSLSRQLLVLRRFNLAFDDVLIIDVRQNATGGDFEQKGRRHKKSDVDRLTEIHGAIEDLISAIDQAFHDKFSRPYRHNVWRKFPLISLLLLASDSR